MSVWKDILAQVENYKQVIEKHTSSSQPLFELVERLGAKHREVVFTGVGSGLNATIPSVYYLMGLGKTAQYIDTTELIYHLMPGIRDSLLVLSTRSGETAELVRAATIAKKEGIFSVVITNETESSVAKLGDLCIPTYSRWDQLVVISAYGGMLVTALLLSSALVRKTDDMVRELKFLPLAVEQTLQTVIGIRQEMLEFIGDGYPLYILGRGTSLASIHGGALVIEETGRRPVVPMATGLFRQGPIEVIDERFRAIVFEGTGEVSELTRHLVEDLIRNKCRIVWVGVHTVAGALNISIPELPPFLLPTVEIIPCQVLAHDLAVKTGINPGSVRYIEKVIKSEVGVPHKREA